MKNYGFKSLELHDFDPEDYHFFGLWPQKLFSCGFWVACYNEQIMKELGIVSEEVGSLELTEGNFCIKKSELENIKKQVNKKIDERDEAFFKNLVSVADRYFQEALVYKETIKTKKLDAGDFENFLLQARKINLIWLLGAEQLSEHVQKRLNEVVEAERFPVDELSTIIPLIETPLNHQNSEVLGLKKEIGTLSLEEVQKENIELYEKLIQHTKQFGWIEIHNFEGEPLSVERLFEQAQLATDSVDAPSKKEIIISENLAFIAKAMAYSGYLRQAGAEYYSMLSLEAQPYLKAIAQKIGVSFEELLLLRDTEIVEALKAKLSSETLKERAKRRVEMDYVLFAGKGKETFFVEDGEDIALLKKLMLPQAEKNTKELVGQVGSKGRYSGRARIIMNNNDFAKMEDGDVLVSTMTTPDFVVLMHKAGAIITDIGGMLCHAAIVSREINKPCIIGTKFATQVLKDGDMVEVDADHGLVRILERV